MPTTSKEPPVRIELTTARNQKASTSANWRRIKNVACGFFGVNAGRTAPQLLQNRNGTATDGPGWTASVRPIDALFEQRDVVLAGFARMGG